MASEKFQQKKDTSKGDAPEQEDPEINPASADKSRNAASQIAKADTEELDELLDEIDTLLESNAEEFVASYVQKGGQ